jgi:transposase
MAFFEALVPCLIGMEACGTAHHWAQRDPNIGSTGGYVSPLI